MTADAWARMTPHIDAAHRAELARALRGVETTPGMLRLVAVIYAQAGVDHAARTCRAWRPGAGRPRAPGEPAARCCSGCGNRRPWSAFATAGARVCEDCWAARGSRDR